MVFADPFWFLVADLRVTFTDGGTYHLDLLTF